MKVQQILTLRNIKFFLFLFFFIFFYDFKFIFLFPNKKKSACSDIDDPFNNTQFRNDYIQKKLQRRFDGGPLFGNLDENDKSISFGISSPATKPIPVKDTTQNAFKSPTAVPKRTSLRRKALSLKGYSSPDLTFVSFFFYFFWFLFFFNIFFYYFKVNCNSEYTKIYSITRTSCKPKTESFGCFSSIEKHSTTKNTNS